MAEYILSHTGEEIDALFGENCTRIGNSPHAEGGETEASGDYAHAEGWKTRATNAKAHAEGDQCVASGDSSHAEGDETIASGKQAHAEGHTTQAIGSSSHAEGKEAEARGAHSHAEGFSTVAEGEDSHAEGTETKARGLSSHAEGKSNGALGSYSHVEGEDNVTGSLEDEWIGMCAHAEGSKTKAVGDYTHSEGRETVALGNGSHAEGNKTQAIGVASHAEGVNTVANNAGEHACGRFNMSNTGENDADKTIFSVGIGTDSDARKNGLEVRENGDIYLWMNGSYVRLQDKMQKMKVVSLKTNADTRTMIYPQDSEYYIIDGLTSELYIFLPDTYSEVNGEQFIINVHLSNAPRINFVPGGGYGGNIYATGDLSISPYGWYEIVVKRVSNTEWIVSANSINPSAIKTITPSGSPQAISEDEEILDTTE